MRSMINRYQSASTGRPAPYAGFCMDLIIRGGCLADRRGLWDVGIRGERIEAIVERIEGSAPMEIQAAGRLVTPTYVNGHVHLDKCHLGDVMRPNRSNSFQ